MDGFSFRAIERNYVDPHAWAYSFEQCRMFIVNASVKLTDKPASHSEEWRLTEWLKKHCEGEWNIYEDCVGFSLNDDAVIFYLGFV